MEFIRSLMGFFYINGKYIEVFLLLVDIQNGRRWRFSGKNTNNTPEKTGFY